MTMSSTVTINKALTSTELYLISFLEKFSWIMFFAGIAIVFVAILSIAYPEEARQILKTNKEYAAIALVIYVLLFIFVPSARSLTLIFMNN